MENTTPDRYDKRMNNEQLKHFMGFFDDVRAHLEHGVKDAAFATETLQAIAYNAIVTIEKINRDD